MRPRAEHFSGLTTSGSRILAETFSHDMPRPGLLKQEEVSFYLGDWEGTKGVTKVERAQTADATEG